MDSQAFSFCHQKISFTKEIRTHKKGKKRRKKKKIYTVKNSYAALHWILHYCDARVR